MDKIIKQKTVNFSELVKNSKTTLSINCQSKMIDLLNKEFTEEQSQWYIANLFLYINYHPTNDYPINLEHVYKMIGFANKGNAMKTIKSNFTENEDYKILLFPMEKQVHGGHNKEDVMLNTDTFKNLCMIAKTPQGKEIRKYYMKLENMNNKIIKEEIEEQRLIQEEMKKQLEEKDKIIEQLENKPDTYGFDRIPGSIYAIEDTAKPGHIKLGNAVKPNDRVNCLNIGSSTYSLKILETFETCDKEFAEKLIHCALNPFRIKNRKEWFYIKNDLELLYMYNTIKKCIAFVNIYNIKNYDDFIELNKEINVQDEIKLIESKKNLQEQIKIDNTKNIYNNTVKINTDIKIQDINNKKVQTNESMLTPIEKITNVIEKTLASVI